MIKDLPALPCTYNAEQLRLGMKAIWGTLLYPDAWVCVVVIVLFLKRNSVSFVVTAIPPNFFSLSFDRIKLHHLLMVKLY